jgi:cysteine desulfurase/selenocysteine lyase
MNIERIREDFPALRREIKGKPVIYFDNACMTLKPRQVIDAMNDYYENYPGCVGRSIHRFGSEATEKYDQGRKSVAEFIGAKKIEEVIFTRNTTEGINLVANSFGLGKGDVILISDREHNSNLLPWHVLSSKNGTLTRIVKSRDDFTFDLEKFEDSLDGVRLVSVVHESNIDGYVLPVEEIIKIAHEKGVPVLLDGAQSVPHMPVNVRKMDVDFLAFSGHKMLGPTGTGILYARQDMIEKLEPFMVGGETVEYTTYDSHRFLPPPERFEAGLQNYAGMIGLGAAADYLKRVGMEDITAHGKKLADYVSRELHGIGGVELVGVRNPEVTSGIVSFNVDKVNFHDVAIILDQTANIMIRSGQHCAHSWFTANGIKGSARASFYLYNTMEEAERLITQVREIVKLR